jgi:hypothetical protein
MHSPIPSRSLPLLLLNPSLVPVRCSLFKVMLANNEQPLIKKRAPNHHAESPPGSPPPRTTRQPFFLPCSSFASTELNIASLGRLQRILFVFCVTYWLESCCSLAREPVHRGCHWLGVVVIGGHLEGPGRCLPGAESGCPIVWKVCARLFAFLGSVPLGIL